MTIKRLDPNVFKLTSPVPASRNNYKHEGMGFASPVGWKNRAKEYKAPPAPKLVEKLARFGGDLKAFLRRCSPNAEQRERYLAAVNRELHKPEHTLYLAQWNELVDSHKQARLELLEFTMIEDLTLTARDQGSLQNKLNEFKTLASSRSFKEQERSKRIKKDVEENKDEHTLKRHAEIMAKLRGENHAG